MSKETRHRLNLKGGDFMKTSFKEKVRGGYSFSANHEDLTLDSRLEKNANLGSAVEYVAEVQKAYASRVNAKREAGEPVKQLELKREAVVEVSAKPEHKLALEVLKAFTTNERPPKEKSENKSVAKTSKTSRTASKAATAKASPKVSEVEVEGDVDPFGGEELPGLDEL